MCEEIKIRYDWRVWRADRVAEGDGLENRCVSNGTGGSNPSPSALPAAHGRRGECTFALAAKMP